MSPAARDRQIGAAGIVDAIVGREDELATLAEFVSDATAPRALLLEGEAGIGKTTLWRAGLGLAREKDCRVLACAPGENEARLPFSALTDLIGDVVDEALHALPLPQHRALRAAFSLSATKSEAVDLHAMGLATATTLRSLAATTPLVLAVDDAQWLDTPSARTLEFVVRRLGDESIAIIAARRGPGGQPAPFGLSRAFGDRVTQLVVGPLDVGQIADVLDRLLAVRLPYATVMQLHRTSGGNPFFALELGRALCRLPTPPAPGEPLPFPMTLEGLLQERLTDVSPPMLDVLGLVAAASRPTLALVDAAAGGTAGPLLADAERKSLIEVGIDGGIRFAHPLLGAAVYSSIPGIQRRETHKRLAMVVGIEEERARHLALAADEPDEGIAQALERAGASVSARGAPDVAADLLEHASRLTPGEERSAFARRTIEAAEQCLIGGDIGRARRLIDVAVEAAPCGNLRARALIALARAFSHESSYTAAVEVLEAALVEAETDDLRARIENDLTVDLMQSSKLTAAATHGHAALVLAETTADPGLLAHAISNLVHVEFLLGNGTRWDLLDRVSLLESDIGDQDLWFMVRLENALVRKWSDDFHGALSELCDLRTWARENGRDRPDLAFHIGELEYWLGSQDAAVACAQDANRSVREPDRAHMHALGLYLNAVVEGHRGRVESAREAVEQALALTSTGANVRFTIRCHAILGFLALSTGDPREAHRQLTRAAELFTELGYRDPGVIRYQADEIEAMLELGLIAEADERTRALEERGRRLDRPWALAVSARCRGLVLAANGDPDAAVDAVEKALSEHERLAQPFEFGRTLLVYGRTLRRARQKRAARTALSRALEVFERLGAPLWAEKARGELGRIGGRAAAPRELTATEANVVELVLDGCTNREIAERLYISVKTVERHLTHVYAKLGVRSRRELARRSRPSQ